MKPKILNELGDGLADVFRAHVAAKLAPIGTRLSACETRVGAMSMLMANKGIDSRALSEVEKLVARVESLEATIEALKHK